MILTRMPVLLITMLVLIPIATIGAEPFDPVLHQKALDFQEWIQIWHTGEIGLPERGLGGLPAAVEFTDDTYSEIKCLHALGDSMIWTGMYLGSQALRYAVTKDPEAKAEAVRVVKYMHDAMDMTDTPGYIPRYADRDYMPYNCNLPDSHGWKVHGTGEWEGYYWVHETSRDQYSGYWWGMTLAYQHVDDEQARAWIKQDLAAVVQMLVDNHWNITDENGEYTGNGAAWIGPLMRLAWLVQAAYVIDEPYYWKLLDDQFALNRAALGIDTSAFINRYSEFYGNNLRHLAYQAIFRLWPDRKRLEFFYETWQKRNRPWMKEIHNPWFDSVHWTGCKRLGACDPADENYIVADAKHTLGLYWEVVNYRKGIICSEQPLDPFSVTMDELIKQYPFLDDIFHVQPQTLDARELTDRHWTDMYWQSGGHFQAACHTGEDRTFVGSGFDYLVAYWMGVYYGILPGDGPYGDDDFDPPDEDPDGADDDDVPQHDDDDESGDDDQAAPEPDDDSDGGCR